MDAKFWAIFEALKPSQPTFDAFAKKTAKGLIQQAADEKTGIAYDALFASNEGVNKQRCMIVLAVVEKDAITRDVIKSFLERIPGGGFNPIDGTETLCDFVFDAFERKSLIITGISNPKSVILTAADPASVKFIEDLFKLGEPLKSY